MGGGGEGGEGGGGRRVRRDCLIGTGVEVGGVEVGGGGDLGLRVFVSCFMLLIFVFFFPVVLRHYKHSRSIHPALCTWADSTVCVANTLTQVFHSAFSRVITAQ